MQKLKAAFSFALGPKSANDRQAEPEPPVLKPAPVEVPAPQGYWLFKSAPHSWSWDNQVSSGMKGDAWKGIRNHQATNNMKRMKPGELGFFYHSVSDKKIVGVLQIVREFEPDPEDEKGKFGLVTVRAYLPMPNPVSLAQIKREPALSGLALVRQPRLSIMPIDRQAWAMICDMGGLHPAP